MLLVSERYWRIEEEGLGERRHLDVVQKECERKHLVEVKDTINNDGRIL